MAYKVFKAILHHFNHRAIDGRPGVRDRHSHGGTLPHASSLPADQQVIDLMVPAKGLEPLTP